MDNQPQYVDLQVNGYAGVDFNGDRLTSEQLHQACRRLREDGVAQILATFITDDVLKMCARVKTLCQLRQRDPLAREVVWGIHIEGPFLSPEPGYVGAHPPQFVRPADLDSMKQLCDAADGLVHLVTLAPENDPGLRVTRWLADCDIIVSAGHCNASLDQLHSAIDAGLSMFTHLGNGCPMTLPRSENIIQRALSLRDRLTLCFIADGVHVPPHALGNFLALASAERSIVVTDAVSAAGAPPGTYHLGDQVLHIGENGVPLAPDGAHFAGSTATMPKMVDLLRRQLGLSEERIEQLTSRNARRLLGIPTASSKMRSV